MNKFLFLLLIVTAVHSISFCSEPSRFREDELGDTAWKTPVLFSTIAAMHTNLGVCQLIVSDGTQFHPDCWCSEDHPVNKDRSNPFTTIVYYQVENNNNPKLLARRYIEHRQGNPTAMKPFLVAETLSPSNSLSLDKLRSIQHTIPALSQHPQHSGKIVASVGGVLGAAGLLRYNKKTKLEQINAATSIFDALAALYQKAPATRSDKSDACQL